MSVFGFFWSSVVGMFKLRHKVVKSPVRVVTSRCGNDCICEEGYYEVVSSHWFSGGWIRGNNIFKIKEDAENFCEYLNTK